MGLSSGLRTVTCRVVGARFPLVREGAPGPHSPDGSEAAPGRKEQLMLSAVGRPQCHPRELGAGEPGSMEARQERAALPKVTGQVTGDTASVQPHVPGRMTEDPDIQGPGCRPVPGGPGQALPPLSQI